MLQSIITDNNVPSSPILVTLMTEAIHSSETSVLTRFTGNSIPEDGILHSHHRKELKSYITIILLKYLRENDGAVTVTCTYE
jgi:hypothetical protein